MLMITQLYGSSGTSLYLFQKPPPKKENKFYLTLSQETS